MIIYNMNILNQVKFRSLYLFILFVSLFSGCSSHMSFQQREQREFTTDSAFRYYYLAMQNLEMGEIDSALANLEVAIHLNPEYAQFYFVKGKIFELQNKPDSAIFYLEKSLQVNDHNPEVWVELGNLYFERNQYDRAIPLLEKSIQQFPDSLNYYLKLGQAYFHQGQFSLSVDILQQYESKATSPDFSYQKWLGMSLFELKQYEQAQKYLAQYIRKSPDDFDALKYLGMSRFHLGDYEKAISLLNKASTLKFGDPLIYLYRARYFNIHHKPQIAIEQLRIAKSLDSLNFDILFEYGKLIFQSGDLEDSKSVFLKLSHHYPQKWEVYRYLGLIEEINGNTKQAIRYYSKYVENTLKYDPEILYKLDVLRKNHKRKIE